MENIKKEINDIENLDNNWDGYNASKVSKKCVDNAFNFISYDLSLKSKIKDIFPNPNGTISFEFGDKPNIIEVEIGDNSFSYYVLKNGIPFFKDKKEFNDENYNELLFFIENIE